MGVRGSVYNNFDQDRRGEVGRPRPIAKVREPTRHLISEIPNGIITKR